MTHDNPSELVPQWLEDADPNPADVKREMAGKMYRTIYSSFELGLSRKEVSQCIEALAQAFCFRDEENPGSVANSLRYLEAHLRALEWPSAKARSMGLCRLGVAMIGTKDVLDEELFIQRLRTITISQVPAALRAVSAIHEDLAHRARLNAAANNCENCPLYDSYVVAAKAAADIAQGIHDSTIAIATGFAGDSANYAASALTTEIRSQQAKVVYFANCALAAGHAQAAASAIIAKTLDGACANLINERVMAEYVQKVVQILRELMPADKLWLDLVPTL